MGIAGETSDYKCSIIPGCTCNGSIDRYINLCIFRLLHSRTVYNFHGTKNVHTRNLFLAGKLLLCLCVMRFNGCADQVNLTVLHFTFYQLPAQITVCD